MNRRVLLIDADTAFRDSLTHELGRYRVVVMTESDPERALALAVADPPTLIVISVEEPDKAGFRLFQKCKKGALSKIPIVLVTASVTAESFAKHRGLKVHADEYLDKRTLTNDELLGKLDNLIELGEPQEDDELSIPVEDDIPLEIAEGDVVLDETVGDDHSHEFGNEMRTVGPDDGISVDSVVEAETDAAFAALLGDDDAGPAPGPASARVASSLPIEIEHEHVADRAMSAAEAEAAAIPEPVPHVLDEREPSEAVPALIHDTDHAHGSSSQIGAPTVDPSLGADDHSEFEDEQPVLQVSSPQIQAPDRYESSPAIPLDDEELVSMDDELPVEIYDEGPESEPSEPAVTSAERGAPSNEAPTVMRAPIHHESPTVLREPIIPDAARPDPRTVPPAKGGSGSHPAIDLGLEMVAHDAESEQSGIYDRRALRKIGELERQIAQLKAELERARSTADAASKGAGREREFLNLRESMLTKDKELRTAKDELAARDHEIGVAREAVRQAQHAKTAVETKNAELEQRLFDDSGKAKELVASARAAAAQAAALQQELAAKTSVATAAEAARVQVERDLATERANRAATASEAERTLRLEREQLIQRHQAELAAARAEAQASEAAVRAQAARALEAVQAETEAAQVTSLVQLRQELETVHATAIAEAVEEVRRANADEHVAAVAKLDKSHAAEMVRIKTDQATELTRIKGELGGELERVKAALVAAETAHADAMEGIAQQYSGQVDALGEQLAAELTAREAAHRTAREHDAATHSAALESLKAELERLAASHDVKLNTARKELDQALAHHEQVKVELHQQHEAATAALGAQHQLELEKAQDDREQLADAARRAAETHRAAVAEMQAKFDAELSQLHDSAGRELAEQKAALVASKRAADEIAARHQAEHETATGNHAQQIAELEAKHERALALASGEILKTKSVADAEHARMVTAHEAATEKLRSDLEAEHVKVLKEVTAERDELRRGLSTARDSLKRSESELASAVQTIADRNAELRAHASAIAERDQRIADLRKEIEGLESENASYQDQVLRAYQKIKTDEAMVARARKAMAIALTVLDDQGNPTSS